MTERIGDCICGSTIAKLGLKPNLEHGSQPLRPTTALRLTRYGLPFAYCRKTWHVAE